MSKAEVDQQFTPCRAKFVARLWLKLPTNHRRQITNFNMLDVKGKTGDPRFILNLKMRLLFIDSSVKS